MLKQRASESEREYFGGGTTLAEEDHAWKSGGAISNCRGLHALLFLFLPLHLQAGIYELAKHVPILHAHRSRWCGATWSDVCRRRHPSLAAVRYALAFPAAYLCVAMRAAVPSGWASPVGASRCARDHILWPTAAIPPPFLSCHAAFLRLLRGRGCALNVCAPTSSRFSLSTLWRVVCITGINPRYYEIALFEISLCSKCFIVLTALCRKRVVSVLNEAPVGYNDPGFLSRGLRYDEGFYCVQLFELRFCLLSNKFNASPGGPKVYAVARCF